MTESRPVSCLIGPTGSGKSEAAVAIARRIGAEIICCDALTVYRGLSILTAKPKPPPDVPHHLLDAVDPTETYSAARFLDDADRLVGEIRGRGRVPLVVGGTALYLKGWWKGLGPRVGRDEGLRMRLAALAQSGGGAALHARLHALDPARAAVLHENDQRRLIRALEIIEATGRPASAFRDEWDGPDRVSVSIVGIRREPADLARRIEERTRAMAGAGLVEEVRDFLSRGNLSREAAQALGLAEMREHIEGRLTLDAALDRIAILTKQFAKRQATFFRQFRSATWIDVPPRATPDWVADRAVESYACGETGTSA